MTEEEAKDKWCPMSIANGMDSIIPCYGSQCMAWVWVQYVEENPEGKGGARVHHKLHGHCGMVK